MARVRWAFPAAVVNYAHGLYSHKAAHFEPCTAAP